MEGADSLAAHGAIFKKQVIRVAEGVHVAVGFGLANSIMIEGEDGRIIVDTMESARAARAVKAEFDRICPKPVRAIIYTHNHYDHIMGAAVFAGDDRPEVISHALLPKLVERSQGALRQAMLPRNIRQFGILLPSEDFLNAGIGPRLVLDGRGSSSSFVPPTRLLNRPRTQLRIAGVDMQLVHAPGETDDQIYVWLPEQRVLLAGDNFYWAFPNLYAIRGTPYRDPRLWADSLDKMLAERPAFLVPSHSLPLVGEDRIREVLTDYRDAIRSVYEQTLAGMNEGLSPDELAERVALPERLADKPYLQPYYGTVSWAVRAIYAGNLGWFDGNASHLFPLPPKQEAERIADLAGGTDALLRKARQALEQGEYQWAAQLADWLMALSAKPGEPHLLKAKALRALGVRQQNANARNYYLAAARELQFAVRRHKANSARQTDASQGEKNP